MSPRQLRSRSGHLFLSDHSRGLRHRGLFPVLGALSLGVPFDYPSYSTGESSTALSARGTERTSSTDSRKTSGGTYPVIRVFFTSFPSQSKKRMVGTPTTSNRSIGSAASSVVGS